MIFNFEHQKLYISFLLIAGFLMLCKMIFRFEDRKVIGKISAFSLSLLSCVAIYGYMRFGNFYDYGKFGHHSYHYDDIFHYTIGAKYFKELGYYNLYEVTYLGFQELEKEGVPIPKINVTRNLRDLSQTIASSETESHKDRLLSAFSSERWIEFKSDIHTFLNVGWTDDSWRGILLDLGFNSPPSEILFAGSLINHLPISSHILEFLPFIDMVLIFIVAGIALFWSFGFYPMCGYIAVLSTNCLASYSFKGGSFLMFDWLACLVIALSFLHTRKYIGAGIFFGLSIGFRVLPVCFFIGSLWALFAQACSDRHQYKNCIQCAIAGLGTLGAMILASVDIYGGNCWFDFYQKIIGYNLFDYVMRLGFNRIAMSLALPFAWSTLLKTALLISACATTLRVAPTKTSLIVGGSLLFLFATPSNYYYVFLALAPVVFFITDTNRYASLIAMMLFFTAFFLISLVPLLFHDDYRIALVINYIILFFFILTYLSFAAEKKIMPLLNKKYV